VRWRRESRRPCVNICSCKPGIQRQDEDVDAKVIRSFSDGLFETRYTRRHRNPLPRQGSYLLPRRDRPKHRLGRSTQSVSQ
jgi:hypothetical protein